MATNMALISTSGKLQMARIQLYLKFSSAAQVNIGTHLPNALPAPAKMPFVRNAMTTSRKAEYDNYIEIRLVQNAFAIIDPNYNK